MVIFWIWFIIPQLLGSPSRVRRRAHAFVIFERVFRRDRAAESSRCAGPVEAATALGLTRRSRCVRRAAAGDPQHGAVAGHADDRAFKDTSLASIIGYVDLTKARRSSTTGRSAVRSSISSSRSFTSSAPTRFRIAARFEHRLADRAPAALASTSDAHAQPLDRPRPICSWTYPPGESPAPRSSGSDCRPRARDWLPSLNEQVLMSWLSPRVQTRRRAWRSSSMCPCCDYGEGRSPDDVLRFAAR